MVTLLSGQMIVYLKLTAFILSLFSLLCFGLSLAVDDAFMVYPVYTQVTVQLPFVVLLH